MLGNFSLIHIGGITRNNEKIFRRIENRLTLQGYICFAPVVYDVEVWKPNKEMLDDMCYEKLIICDIFLIETPWHIGESTKLRIQQSKELNIPIMVYNFITDKLEEFDEEKDYGDVQYSYT